MKIFIVALLLIFTVSGCNKEYSYEGGKTISLTNGLADSIYINDTTDFYDIVLDRQRQVHVMGHYLTSFSGGSGDSLGIILHYFFYPDAITDFEFYKGVLPKDPSDSNYLSYNQKEIKSLLPGFYPYTSNSDSLSGIFITITDSAGVRWSTSFGEADESTGFFQIVKQINRDIDYSTTGVSHWMHIVCNFACVLYDGKGKTKKITNGRLGVTLWI